MNKWLSILIPSKRPELLDDFIESLRKNTSDLSGIEIVILVDDKMFYVEYATGITTIHFPKQNELNISELQNECYRVSSGKWIMLGNDDVLMETPDWDLKLKKAMDLYPDELALFYFDDGMFGRNLACFPIISRKLINSVELFPMPYRRYKVDDTIFNIFPPERRIYLEDIKMIHCNDTGQTGFTLPDGRIYPIIREVADYDNNLWEYEENNRNQMRKIVRNMIGMDMTQKILIGIPTQDATRYTNFYDYFNVLEKPNGTLCTFSRGQSPARNRNLIIQQAIENNCTHLLFLDDDIAFKPELLTNLLKHDKDIVSAFYLMRNYPHQPILFDKQEKDGSCGYFFPTDEDKGLIEIVNCGLGACLIKTEVFYEMQKPWITLGELEKDQWCDDISFFNRARKLGYRVYVDLDTVVGHMAAVTIWPNRVDGKWYTSYDTGGTSQVTFPMVRPLVEEMK